MSTPQSLLVSAFSGGGTTSRHGDTVVVKFPASTFATNSVDYKRVESWARARLSIGNANRDRAAFVDRFENLLARSGGGIATRGNRPALRLLITGLKQAGMEMDQWSVPHNINESVEATKRPPAPGATAKTGS
ncbi:MAG: hypothetical protein K0Q76_807 [Panacagrimonas sp.]|nr:hypothetical protein [Panacagrimonas sp.]MCC2655699.1 hypothetical protein [Panacagrimonas sp.]